MKNYFKADIQGRGFFKTYILFFIPIVVLSFFSNPADETRTLFSAIASIADSYLSMLLGFAFFCYAVKSVFFKDEGFLFEGSLGRFAPKALKWLLLSIITLGIYTPWYVRNYINFYLENLSYKNEKGEFQSRAGTLLKYMFLLVYLPVIVLTVIMAFFLIRSSGNFYPESGFLFGAAAVVIVFLILIPFIYFYFLWLINIRFAGYKITFNRSLSETAGFLIVQILLSIITVFIYYPAACVKIFKFLAEGTSLATEAGSEAGSFGFDGPAGKGFGLLWGQALLSIITVGIYGPWAMSKVSSWFISNTFIEGDIKIGE